MDLFADIGSDYLLTPCATCTSTITKIWPMMDRDLSLGREEDVRKLSASTMDISEFLVDVLQVKLHGVLLMCSRVATSALDNPSATSARISCLRCERGDLSGGVAAPPSQRRAIEGGVIEKFGIVMSKSNVTNNPKPRVGQRVSSGAYFKGESS